MTDSLHDRISQMHEFQLSRNSSSGTLRMTLIVNGSQCYMGFFSVQYLDPSSLCLLLAVKYRIPPTHSRLQMMAMQLT